MTSFKNMIAKVPVLLLVGLFGISLAPSAALAANTFNAAPNDLLTTYISNATRFPNSNSNWVTSETANPGEIISVEVYYHNNSTQAAQNTAVRILVPTGQNTDFQFTGSVKADGFAGASSNVSLHLPSGQTLTYIPGSFKWWPNQAQPLSNPIRIPPGGQAETALFSPAGMTLGSIAADSFPGSFSGQGNVVVSFRVSDTVVVPPQAPTLSLYANPMNVQPGQTSTLNWSSTNATQCTASNGWSGNRALSGSEATAPLYQNTTFTMTCTGAGGSVTQSVAVTVAQVNYPPTLSLYTNPTTVNAGQSSNLNWSSAYATNCYASGDWSGNRALTGSETTGALYGDRSFTMTCTGPGGSVTRSAYVSVISQVNPPTLNLTVYPGVVQSGEYATLTWTTTNATDCNAYGDWSGYKSTNGSQSTGALYSNRTYTMTCTGPGGTVTRSVNVVVNQQNQNPAVITSLYASPSTINSGSISTLYWTSVNATSCYLSGPNINENVSVNGSRTTGSLFQTSTYTLTCTGQGGSDTRTATVGVISVTPTQNPPIVLTSSATNVLTNSAVLNGSVNYTSCGLAGASSWFEYGISPNALNLATARFQPFVTQGDFSRVIIGLSSDTTYYFRAVGENNCGRAYGQVLSFRTAAVLGDTTPPPPTLVARVSTSKSVQNVTAAGVAGTNIQARMCDTVRYTLTVENTGERNLTNVRVSDKLANLLEFVSASGNGTYTDSTRTLRWTIPSLSRGATEVLTFDALVGPCRIPAGIDNSASTGSDQTSTRVSNGTTITVAPLGLSSPTTGTNQPTTPAVTDDESDSDSDSQTAGVAFFDSLLPQTVIGWVLLLLLLVVIILFAKKALESRRGGDDAGHGHGAPAH